MTKPLIPALLAALCATAQVQTPLTVMQSAGTATGALRLQERRTNGTDYVAIQAPQSISTSLTFTLPSADGTSGQCLQTDGAGALSFATCNTLPVVDTTTIVKGSADATKLLRFEVDGFTTGTTRVMTPPNADATLAGINLAQTWTASQTFQHVLFAAGGTYDVGTHGARPRTVFAGDLDASGNATAISALTDTLLHTTGNNTAQNITLMDSVGASNKLVARRTHGTAASPAPLVSGDTIFELRTSGRGDTAYSNSANGSGFAIRANQAWTDSANGTYITFLTTPDGSPTAVEAWDITNAGYIIPGPSNLSGRIGIGTRTPAALLDVNGQAKVSSLTVTTGASSGYVLTSDGSGNATWAAGSSQWITSGSNIYYSTGNVGVGASNPQGKIEAFSSVDATTTPLISIRSDFAAAGRYGMIRFGDQSQTSGYQKGALIYEGVATSARGRMHIALENTDGAGSVALSDARLTVTSAGKVGIGETNPSEALTISATNPMALFYDGINRLKLGYGSVTSNVGEAQVLADSAAGNLLLSSRTNNASGIHLYTNAATSAVKRWEITSAGHLLAGADNTYDIGASGATRPRHGYFGGIVGTASGFQVTGLAAPGTRGGLEIRYDTSGGTGSNGASRFDVFAPGGTTPRTMLASVKDIQIYTGVSSPALRWTIDSDGHILPATSNSYDLGSGGATLKNGHFAGTLATVGLTATGAVTISGTISPGFDGIGSVGSATYRYGNVYTYGLSATGTVTFSGSTVTLSSTISSDIIPTTNNSYAIGTTGAYYNMIRSESIRTHGGNVAPATTGSGSLGASSARWLNTFTTNLNVSSSVTAPDGNLGFTGTKTVRASGGASDCTLVYSAGILTGGTC